MKIRTLQVCLASNFYPTFPKTNFLIQCHNTDFLFVNALPARCSCIFQLLVAISEHEERYSIHIHQWRGFSQQIAVSSVSFKLVRFFPLPCRIWGAPSIRMEGWQEYPPALQLHVLRPACPTSSTHVIWLAYAEPMHNGCLAFSPPLSLTAVFLCFCETWQHCYLRHSFSGAMFPGRSFNSFRRSF